MPKTRIEPGSINSSIATRLKEVAQILEEQRANIFRVGAYRQAAAIMAERLHDELGIETLEELEIAAHDGRLARVSGFGPKRIAGIRDSLATRLGRVRGGGFAQAGSQPPVSEILDVDRKYRRKSSQGLLPGSRRDDSIRSAKNGYPYSTRLAEKHSTQRCSQILQGRTN